MVEIDSPDAFTAWLMNKARERVAVQSLDLRGFEAGLFAIERGLRGSLFLGCQLTPRSAAHLVQSEAVVLNLKGFRFAIHRRRLYGPDELFDGYTLGELSSYRETLDYKVYEDYLATGGHDAGSIEVTLAQRLHDHSITDALNELRKDKKVVAIMGGHGLERSAPMYASVARIARTLTRLGFLMISGGGPGAMEATHLGAYLANRDDDDDLEAALAILGERPEGSTPGREYADADWLDRAMQVRQRFPIGEPRFESIGIPTWHYGHEPPAPFATQIAKYFANSVREEGLLAIANHGVIYAPGSAGTTQEIFQDATQNHYGSYGGRAPMLLFGIDHWTRVRPVWPLLKHVATGKIYDELLFLTDSEDAIVRRVRSFDPAVYAT